MSQPATEAGSTTTAPASPAAPATPPPASPATTPPAETTPPKTAPAAEETPEQKIERLQAEVKAANAEAAKSRTTAKQNAADEARKELAQTIGKALGLVEDEAVDPAKLTEQVSSLTADNKQAKLELAIFHAAGPAGADPAKLLDSRNFMQSVAEVDPSDTAAVAKAITEAVAANQAFAVTPTSRVPAPNPAQGSSAAGAPDIDSQIAEAQKRGDVKAVIHLQNQKLTQPS
jgi:hypothetical protein